MKPGISLRCEVIKSNDDEFGNRVASVKCHGRLASDAVLEIREVVKPLVRAGGALVG